MKAFGYMGNVLSVNLSSGEFETKKLELGTAQTYLGGLGLNAWLMEQTYTGGTDPFSPDNPVIFGAGPLVGTGVPGASKIVATTRFPLNGTISESTGSMRFATNLKGAGFDHLIVTGKAKKPVILVLEGGHISLVDAKGLWGLDIPDTTERLKRTYSGTEPSVIAIGPAGENKIPFAITLVDKASTLGRCGLGSVFGSKNLKAIVVMGRNRPNIHDPKKLKVLIGGMRERLKKYKNHKRVLELGFMEGWDTLVRKMSFYRNFSQAFPPDRADELYGLDVYRSFNINRFGCPSCVTPDKDALEIIDGPYKGFRTTTTSYINSYLVGQLFDLNQANDKTASIRFLDRLDRMGVDMFTFGHMLDFLITEHEQGELDADRFGLPLKQDLETLNRWLEAIAYRMGPAGDILAGGWVSLLEYLGDEFKDHAPVIKNCEVLYDPRLAGLGTMEFEQIVSLKGPRSGSGGSPTFIVGLTEENLPLFCRHLDRMGASEDAIQRIMDSPMGFNVGRMTRYSEDWYAILSSMGICNRAYNNRFYSLEICWKLFRAVTGFEVEKDALRRAAVRIWDTLKVLNQKEGFGPSADHPPDMWFKPMMGADSKQLVLRDYFGKSELRPDDISGFVEDYYDERGWTDGLAGPSAEIRDTLEC